MVAIASLPTTSTAPGRALRAVPAHRPGPGVRRPALTLVAPANTAARRSLASVAGAVLLALAVVFALGYLAATPATSPGAAVAGTHVVAEGETMWSIAVQRAPAGEAAGYVERLVAANGVATVTPGQQLSLPAP